MGSPCCCNYFPKRYITVICTCAGMLIVHAMRVNMAVAVVTILDAKPNEKVGSEEAIASLPEVEWDSFMVGFLHAVFYVGYIMTQIPGGYLCQVLPSHRLFGGCILISSVLNLVLPVAIAKVGYEFTCIIRVLQGISEGLLYPSTYAILRHWTTPEERSRMGAITLTGVYIGPVMGLMLSGYLGHVYGWMYIFYVHGGIGILWFLFWFILSFETPASHPQITTEELKYITERQGQTAVIYEHDSIPWKSILLSLPVHALNVCNFGRSFVFFFLLTNEPTFLNVFGYTLAENGVLSALPHALMAFIAAISGPIADLMIGDVLLTRTQVRKLFTCLGFGTEALCLYFLAIIEEGTSALIFLTIGVGISGFTISGWQINHLDLAPRYASVLVGITTTVGTLAGILNPILVGWMTAEQTIQEWQKVFIMTASVLAFTVLFYLVFGSGEMQPWSEPKPQPEKIIHPKMSGLVYGTFPAQLSDKDLNTSTSSKKEHGAHENNPIVISDSISSIEADLSMKLDNTSNNKSCSNNGISDKIKKINKNKKRLFSVDRDEKSVDTSTQTEGNLSCNDQESLLKSSHKNDT